MIMRKEAKEEIDNYKSTRKKREDQSLPSVRTIPVILENSARTHENASVTLGCVI